MGGPTLGAHAITAGLVDEVHLFVWPVVVGGGKHFLPDRARLQLELLDERRFGSGVVYLRYRTQDLRDADGARSVVEVMAEELGPSLTGAPAASPR